MTKEMEIPEWDMPYGMDTESMTNYLLAVIAKELRRMNDLTESKIKY
jgi:hypothetical protein